MAGYDRGPTWLPPWVHRLGIPLWVTGPDHTLRHFNARAEALLGLSSQSIGCPCYSVIGGLDADGSPHCLPLCPTFCQAQRGCELEPITLRIRGHDDGDLWLQVVVIATQVPRRNGLAIVHCALDARRDHRMESYFARVASRTSHDAARDKSFSLAVLSAREREIFSLLCADTNLAAIADCLHVSPVTVRNHVQHILEKLGTHSMAEAIARFMLSGEP